MPNFLHSLFLKSTFNTTRIQKQSPLILLCFLTFLSNPSNTRAQSADSLASGHSVQADSSKSMLLPERDTTKNVLRRNNDLIRILDAGAHVVTAPIRWKGKDYLTFGGVVGASALLAAVADQPVRKFWQKENSGIWHGIERAGYHYGKPYATYIMSGGFYLSGLLFKNEWARETGTVLVASYLSAGAVQTLMKTVIGRARPSTERGQWVFRPMDPTPAYHSFPSGHIQVAMVSAMVLAERVENPWLKGLFYSTAGVTLISRMYSDAHWTSDLFFGSAISYFCTKSILKRMEANRYKKNKPGKISWIVTPSSSGLAAIGHF